MFIKVLGTGGAIDSLPTSYIINTNILVDCGMEIVKKIILSKEIDNIKHIFFTHLHMDHFSGFELFCFYKISKKQKFNVYSGSDFMDFYKQLKCSKESFTGKNIQPFIFTEIRHLDRISIENNVIVNIIGSNHCGKIFPNFSFLFMDSEDPFYSKKILISGDIDNPLDINNIMLQKQNIICFHDMGWTGLEDYTELPKVHPYEEEIYNKIGPSDRLFGIHVSDKVDLKYYEKAEIDKLYFP